MHPTVAQAVTMTLLLGLCCDLYNGAVQERRDAWRWRKSQALYRGLVTLPRGKTAKPRKVTKVVKVKVATAKPDKPKSLWLAAIGKAARKVKDVGCATTYVSQCRALTEIRATVPGWSDVPHRGASHGGRRGCILDRGDLVSVTASHLGQKRVANLGVMDWHDPTAPAVAVVATRLAAIDVGVGAPHRAIGVATLATHDTEVFRSLLEAPQVHLLPGTEPDHLDAQVVDVHAIGGLWTYSSGCIVLTRAPCCS